MVVLGSQNFARTHFPQHYTILGQTKFFFFKSCQIRFLLGSDILHMTSEELEEMFEGDFADTCVENISAVAERSIKHARLEAMTPSA